MKKVKESQANKDTHDYLTHMYLVSYKLRERHTASFVKDFFIETVLSEVKESTSKWQVYKDFESRNTNDSHYTLLAITDLDE